MYIISSTKAFLTHLCLTVCVNALGVVYTISVNKAVSKYTHNRLWMIDLLEKAVDSAMVIPLLAPLLTRCVDDCDNDILLTSTGWTACLIPIPIRIEIAGHEILHECTLSGKLELVVTWCYEFYSILSLSWYHNSMSTHKVWAKSVAYSKMIYHE